MRYYSNKIRDEYEKLKQSNQLPAVRESVKDEANAAAIRETGNQHFGKRNYVEALRAYNECLCHAPAGSESMGLAYANRSAIYLETGFFRFCLENIELALSNGYPERLQQKLLERKEACLAAKETKADSEEVYRVKHQIKLSHPSNPKIPFAIEALKVEKTEQFGRFIVTTKDLKPGDVILIEEPSALFVKKTAAYSQCMNCGINNYFNLKPCATATTVMFCSDKCSTEAWDRFYKFEAPVTDSLFNEIPRKAALLASRIVLGAFTMVGSNWEGLKKLISSTPGKSAFDIDFTNTTEMEKFQALYELETNAGQYGQERVSSIVRFCASVWHILKQSDAVKNLLKEREAENLFLNLMMHFVEAIDSNSVEQSNSAEMEVVGEGCRVISCATGVFLVYSLFNHSCTPNVEYLPGLNATYVTRPIKAGQPVLTSYGPHFYNMAKADRQGYLKQVHCFKCVCHACVRDYPLSDFLDIKARPPMHMYQWLNDVLVLSRRDLSPKEVKKFMKELAQYLTKHDKDTPSQELMMMNQAHRICFVILYAQKQFSDIFAAK